MVRPSVLLGGLAVVVATACQPNATGGGTGMANSLGGPMTDGDTDGMTGTPTDGAMASSGADAGGTGTTPPDDGTSTDDPPPGDTGPGTPMLSVSDGPTYDFGDVDVGTERAHPFTVTNEGDGTATGIVGGALAPPFSFSGGGFPGTRGTCGNQLAPGESCTVEAAFGPTSFGPFDATLVVLHDGGTGMAARPITGGGVGESDNLLGNPGGEMTGNPPPSWTNAGVGVWLSGDWVTPHSGSRFLGSDSGPDNAEYWLVQQVDAAPWAATIDQGVLRFRFQGYVRSLSFNNDLNRIRVRYLDGGGGLLTEWDSNWGGNATWELRQDIRLAPAGTRAISVELGCIKTSGSWCDAYYDTLELRAVYP